MCVECESMQKGVLSSIKSDDGRKCSRSVFVNVMLTIMYQIVATMLAAYYMQAQTPSNKQCTTIDFTSQTKAALATLRHTITFKVNRTVGNTVQQHMITQTKTNTNKSAMMCPSGFAHALFGTMQHDKNSIVEFCFYLIRSDRILT